MRTLKIITSALVFCMFSLPVFGQDTNINTTNTTTTTTTTNNTNNNVITSDNTNTNLNTSTATNNNNNVNTLLFRKWYLLSSTFEGKTHVHRVCPNNGHRD